MHFLTKEFVIDTISQAIVGRNVLSITYQHTTGDQDTVIRKKAPFDIGTTNPKTISWNKDNLYAFCYDHVDEKTGTAKPMVHALNIEHIISIDETGEIFDEKELADIHKANSDYNYDYRTCQFALVSERAWF